MSLQDSTGLPGDHFSLEGALSLLKKSASLEDFEKKLNQEGGSVNNLDLNKDHGRRPLLRYSAIRHSTSSWSLVLSLSKDNPQSAILRIRNPKSKIKNPYCVC